MPPRRARSTLVTMFRLVNTWFEENRWAGDAVIAGVLFVVFGASAAAARFAPGMSVTISLLLVAPLFFRRTAPRLVVLASVAVCLLQLAIAPYPVVGDLVIPIVVHTAALHIPDRRWGAATLGTAIVGAGLASWQWTTTSTPGTFYGRIDLGQIAFLFLAGTAGVVAAYLLALRQRDKRDHAAEQLAALAERNRLLTAERDRRIEAAAAAERARIARELHDIVAHSLSVIVVQADGGAAAAERTPDLAPAVLRTIADTSRDALGQMRRMVSVLRSQSGEDAAGYAPTPGPADLPDLIAQVRATGLPIDVTTIGTERALSADAGLAVYRIVQESLTNVLKHAGPAASVRIVLHFAPSEVVVSVTDDGRGAAASLGDAAPPGPPSGDDEAPGAGHGLEGMRERVSLLGGSVHAAPRTGGGFEVSATVPYGIAAAAAATAGARPNDVGSR